MIGGERKQQAGGSPTLTARVTALLERQHELLVQLEVLSRHQIALIEADETERLLDLLRERQRVIDALQDAGEQLEPLRPAWSEALAGLPAAEREAARQRVEAVAVLLDQIALRDGEASQRLKARRDLIAAELLGMERGRGALAAYGGHGRTSVARFSDREA
jgi:hypothetical protein